MAASSVMDKHFVSFESVRDNGIKLAHRIYNDGFIPDVIYVSLRGGAYLGNIISEYFKLISARNNLKPVLYAAVVARSYENPQEQTVNISIDGWTYNPTYLRNGDRVLLVDDIYDTGNTINYLAHVIAHSGINPEHLKIAVHDYKVRTYLQNSEQKIPDYYCRKFVISDPARSGWIHYLSHELVGLTDEEIDAHYPDDTKAILRDPSST